MLRVVIGIIVILLTLLVVKRKQISAWRRSNTPELSMPFCTKCESNRRIIPNPGDMFSPTEYPWFCLTCQEAF